MKNKPYKFNSLENARSFAARCEKAHAVVTGTDRKFWVLTMADFNRAIKAGLRPA